MSDQEEREAADGPAPADASEEAVQLTTPDGGEPWDTESTEVADYAGRQRSAGPESAAVHIEDA
ncbi:hypothetical protein [Amycolatopsis regifaucium]|uniref:Uncharacterized protein n=1 Tax=Amycolatopsis regifaucium TaxID=546365 RepID=A0A154MS68_9PSEU|nr:hypothetical protein [Amycolatopsis regifaucium]KZB87174.1 hypothetical protein AVL48_21100 [Amycolatopsis regifaucium]OKA08003.1 hypothetical protein ATP06_0211860 [Amycolatopsis regifaucium]SFI35958.1 hypothetical protein SAMN04489731_11032 [Amycolatopsis regifaucium]